MKCSLKEEPTITTAIILAAGKGTRMRSARPKMLHDVAGRPMIAHVVAAARDAGATQIIAVLGHGADAVRAALPPEVHTVVQEPQLGTGHAVRVALAALDAGDAAHEGSILIVNGDMPLITAATLRALLETHTREGSRLSFVSVRMPDPAGYGRVLRDAQGRVTAVKEHKELAPAELDIAEINCGIYCADAGWLCQAIARLPEHSDGEYYLPDVIPWALSEGGVSVVQIDSPDEVQGVNTRVQLAAAEAAMRMRINEQHMLAGVTMVDPATTYIEPGVRIGRDTIIYPNTHLGGETTIGENCVLGPDTEIRDSALDGGVVVTRSVVEGTRIASGCRVGPFAHLRPGTVLHQGVEIGNYAELKNTTVGPGSVSHHVSYLGDATIGRDTNIGAGTITANYDGVRKNPTTIGDNVFVGSDTVLRAPVTLGDGCYTGAGAVVTHDVPPGTVVAGVPARELRKARGTSDESESS